MNEKPLDRANVRATVLSRMPQCSIDDAIQAVSEATDLVVKDGGVIHEDNLWNAQEMALDRESTESIAKRIKDARDGQLYRPRGGWTSR
jgi:hypothetical protein